MTNNEKNKLKSVNYEIITQIIEARMENGMTQSELATKSGTKQSNISRLESGSYNPTLELLDKIAEALNMKLEVKMKSKTCK